MFDRVKNLARNRKVQATVAVVAVAAAAQYGVPPEATQSALSWFTSLLGL